MPTRDAEGSVALEERSATKIVATIGPASETRLESLVTAGMSVARINFSHGSAQEHRERTRAIRAAAERCGVPVAILADLQGPKLRLGRVEGGRMELNLGERYHLVEGDQVADPGEIRFDFTGLHMCLSEGDRVFLADGAVELLVEKAGRSGWIGVVVREGTIADRRGVHFPDSSFSFQLPTKQDVEDIALARELGVDMLGVSFVSKVEELVAVRRLAGNDIQLIAKIERRAALENRRGILEACDGVMVARGDLGVEVELEQLPLVQKELIQASLRAGRFVITATEMLESMVTASRPTRAEVADVANAVLDGTDAVMLSAETAIGDHPVEAVRTMTRIARTIEASQRYHDLPRTNFRDLEPTFSNATAMAAVHAAEALKLGHIICFTESGNTVRQLSRYRPAARILAVTPRERTLRGMSVLWNVWPVLCPRWSSLEDLLERGQRLLTEKGLVVTGEEVLFVAGVPPGVSRSTNLMKLHRIGDKASLHGAPFAGHKADGD
jgi:pyruvate kinase